MFSLAVVLVRGGDNGGHGTCSVWSAPFRKRVPPTKVRRPPSMRAQAARSLGTDGGLLDETGPPAATLAIYPRIFAKCSPHKAEFAIFIRNLQPLLLLLCRFRTKLASSAAWTWRAGPAQVPRQGEVPGEFLGLSRLGPPPLPAIGGGFRSKHGASPSIPGFSPGARHVLRISPSSSGTYILRSDPRHVRETRVVLQEGGVCDTGWPVPMLGHDDLRDASVRAVAVVHLVSVGEQNRVTVLLERATFA